MSTPPAAPQTPHDSLFRKVFGAPENAAGQLRSALPPDLVDRLDLDRLTPVPGTMIDPDLRARHSDLIFKAPLDGEDAFIYVLVEHQSSVDQLMAFRLLRYVIMIIEGYLEQNPKATRVPAVIPLVVHHDPERRWTAPTQMLDLFDLAPDTAKIAQDYLPRFRFLVDDLARLDVAALRARPMPALAMFTLFLLQYVRGNPRLPQDLRPLTGTLRLIIDRPDGREWLDTILHYIQNVGEVSTFDALHDFMVNVGPVAEEAYVTIAEALEAKGEVTGEAKGRAKTIIRLLTIRFGPLPEDVLQTVRGGSDRQFDTWTDRVLTARTLDEVLRGTPE